MRHRNTIAKLGRTKDHRDALLRNLATTMALHGNVTTTTPKAKALASFYEHLIALAKRKPDSFSAIRVAKKHLYTPAAQKAFVQKLPSQKNASGHLRMIKIGFRKGDGTETTRVELLSEL